MAICLGMVLYTCTYCGHIWFFCQYSVRCDLIVLIGAQEQIRRGGGLGGCKTHTHPFPLARNSDFITFL